MSICTFKMLFNQIIFTRLNKKLYIFQSSKLMSEVGREKVACYAETKDGQYCRNFLENQRTQHIRWDSLEQDLSEKKSANIRSTIIKSCQFLKRADLAIDYCQYITNKGEKLSFVETCFFIRALANCEINLDKYDKLTNTIFDHSCDLIFSIPGISVEAMTVFSQNSSCFKKLIAKYEKGEIDHHSAVSVLVAAAFNCNQPELAWKIANKEPEKCLMPVFKSYLRFCIRLAEQNKFSVDMMNDLINFSKTHTVVVKFDDFYKYVEQLITVLNKSKTAKYLWIINECKIIKGTLCSSCQYKFQLETVTADELKLLKEIFLKKVIICNNINIKTTPEELKNFLDYLENCRPFDVVIDLLNFFKGCNYKEEKVKKFILYFKNRGMRILYIARDHCKNFQLYKLCEQNSQIFLTRNDTVDDVFCLYAAMHNGVGTYFFTSDFFRDHAHFFEDPALIALFCKWQISHQYRIMFNHSKIMLPPRHHSDLPQSSVTLNKNSEVLEYQWHLSYLKARQNYRIEMPTQWICVTAKAKT